MFLSIFYRRKGQKGTAQRCTERLKDLWWQVMNMAFL